VKGREATEQEVHLHMRNWKSSYCLWKGNAVDEVSIFRCERRSREKSASRKVGGKSLLKKIDANREGLRILRGRCERVWRLGEKKPDYTKKPSRKDVAQ